jgi:hypothetical protein
LTVVKRLALLTGGDKIKCLKLRKVRLRMLYVALHEVGFRGLFKDGLMRG